MPGPAGVRLVLVLFLSLVALLLSIVPVVRLAARLETSPFWFDRGLRDGTVHILTAMVPQTDRSRASCASTALSRWVRCVLFAALLRARQLPRSVQIGDPPLLEVSIALPPLRPPCKCKPYRTWATPTAINLFHIASAPFVDKMPSTRSSPSRLKSRFFVIRLFLVAIRHSLVLPDHLLSCPPLPLPHLRHPDLVSSHQSLSPQQCEAPLHRGASCMTLRARLRCITGLGPSPVQSFVPRPFSDTTRAQVISSSWQTQPE